MLDVQRHVLPLPGLAAPVHLVQLTDLHFGWATPRSRLIAAVEQTNRLAPDIVVLTGDVVSWRPRSVRHVRATLGALAAPRIAVLGNHDHHVGAALVTEALQEAGFLVLQNERIAMGGLVFVGVDDPITGHADPVRAMGDLSPEDGAIVGLVHDPRAAPSLWRCGIELVLSGHTHGGHFDIGRLPERVLRTPFVAGLHQTDHGTVYVCPGLGSATFRWRWGPRSVPALGSLLLTASPRTSRPGR
jgi:predicted MPP superfamily phosphohydrolase